MGNCQGEHLSVHKISQAYPGAPEITEEDQKLHTKDAKEKLQWGFGLL